ncbi:MAG: hypothetical protein QNJ54_24745 [Prochloraceae cyanobacterium]|nr:hypothetical protein [Prochloraceae cyanobacterium]
MWSSSIVCEVPRSLVEFLDRLWSSSIACGYLDRLNKRSREKSGLMLGKKNSNSKNSKIAFWNRLKGVETEDRK